MPHRRRSPRDPVAVAAAVAAVTLLGFVLLLVTWSSSGRFGAPPGQGVPRVDFAAFWGAARLTAQGRPELSYSWPALAAELRRGFGTPVGAPLPFFYPPAFLLVLAPLGRLPYGAAFFAWVAATLAAYAAAVWTAWPRPAAVLVALAAPGVLCCVFVGQNGLLTAAVFAAGLALLPRRPVLAGAILALLALKPQFALILPLVLLAAGWFRALTALAVGAAALTLASCAVLGAPTTLAFLHAARTGGASFTADGWLAWSKVQSVYGVLRAGGVPATEALSVHAALALAAAAAVVSLWRGGAPFALKASAAAAGALLMTPYTFFYDTPLLGVSAVFLLKDVSERGGLTRVQAVAVLAACLAPLAFYIQPALILTPLAAAALLAVTWRRARMLRVERPPAEAPAAISGRAGGDSAASFGGTGLSLP